MKYPYEQIAKDGGEMPDGLDLIDQTTFQFLRLLYANLRRGQITLELAIEEKGKMTYQYNRQKGIYGSEQRLSAWHNSLLREIEGAQNQYRKCRTLENADTLSDVVDGRLSSIVRMFQ